MILIAWGVSQCPEAATPSERWVTNGVTHGDEITSIAPMAIRAVGPSYDAREALPNNLETFVIQSRLHRPTMGVSGDALDRSSRQRRPPRQLD